MTYKRYCYKCGRENATWNPKCEFCTQNDVIERQAEQSRRQAQQIEQQRQSEELARLARQGSFSHVESPWDRYIRFAEADKKRAKEQSNQLCMPVKVPTPEELAEKAAERQRIDDYVSEMIWKFFLQDLFKYVVLPAFILIVSYAIYKIFV